MDNVEHVLTLGIKESNMEAPASFQPLVTII